MPATRPVGELREQASKVILKKLEELTITEAARDLHLSRQAIYGFKSGKYCPSLAVIHRACAVWKLEFNVLGMMVSEQSFSQGSERTGESPAKQITMFDLWEQLENRRMTVVRAERIDGAVEMTLRIAIA